MEENNKKIPHINEQIEHEVMYDNEWITVRKNQGYYYSERKGVDSVAFVLFGINIEEPNRIGLIKEKKYPINKEIIGAFGGSIDQEHFKDDLRILVKEEVMEESGFNVSLDDITFYGRVFVSTQMNQYCYLFGVSVNKLLQGTRTSDNPRELDSTVVWLTLPEILHLEDWKALNIVTKRMAAANSIITVKPINKNQMNE